jgi:hypothetical protein
MLWTGRALSALPVLAMAMSAAMKLSHAPQFVEMWTGHLGFPESALTGVGLLELACVLLYAVPRTAVLGAVLLTGYLGGAITAHVRIGDPGLVTPLMLGILAWAGLFLRDERVRALMPLRK